MCDVLKTEERCDKARPRPQIQTCEVWNLLHRTMAESSPSDLNSILEIGLATLDRCPFFFFFLVSFGLFHKQFPKYVN